MRSSIPAALFGAVLAFAAVPAAALDTVYVVRHAQKDPLPDWKPIDAFRPLSSKGARCAGLLSKVLKFRGIAAVYTSELTRTLATGLAVSTTRDDVEVIGDDRTLKPTPELARELRERHSEDQAILIVGHSNTVGDLVFAFRPDLEKCFGKRRLQRPAIPDKQYGDVWRLNLAAGEGSCNALNLQRLGRAGDEDCSTP